MNEIVYKPNEYDLKMQKVYLDIWKEFDRVAKKNNLTYFLFNGTLIGAARHQGFIPWDDDFDIAMPRKDYDRLQYELSGEFQAPFFFQSFLTDPTHFSGLNRVRKSDTTMILRYDYGHPCNNGVYMDIYPMDNLPDDPKKCKKINDTATLFRLLFFFHVYGRAKPSSTNEKYTVKQNLVKLMSKIIFAMFGEADVYKYFQKKLGAYKDENCKYAATISVHPNRKSNVWFTEDMKETTHLTFEGYEMPVPIGWDRCMKRRYGDYMQIPPADQQKPIHQTKAYMNPDIPYTEVTWNPFENRE